MNKLISIALTICCLLSVFAVSPAGATGIFKDVSESDWFYEDVQFCYDAELMVGTSGDTFEPEGKLSRAMVVTMLYRMVGEPEVNDAEIVFDDVPSDSWYTDAVLWAYEKNIAYGISDVCFAPEKDVTRAELAAFIYRYIAAEDLRISLALDVPEFADGEDIAKYAALPVSALYRAEIIKGKPGNMFEPSAYATRAEGAALLNRVVTLAPKQEYTLLEKHGMTANVFTYINKIPVIVEYGEREASIYENHQIIIELIFESQEYPKNVTVTGKITNSDVTVDLEFEQDLSPRLIFRVNDLDAKAAIDMKEGDGLIVEYTVTIGDEAETYIAYEKVYTVY
ncbi:MAG: S-layer homology domain-containing protein [Oscillospiraceae bacterium]|nr:S-layer homology domain-containing protein [Oscillospiraceae bacterium]